MANPTVILLFILAARCGAVSVWPQPKNMSWPVKSSTPLSPCFSISSPQLIKTENYHPLVTPKVNPSDGPSLQILIITVNNLAAPLTHGVNESYSLSIPMSGNRATLIAESAWGDMRGLETFSQLIGGKPSRGVAGVEVVDWLCPQRGSPRHFKELGHPEDDWSHECKQAQCFPLAHY